MNNVFGQRTVIPGGLYTALYIHSPVLCVRSFVCVYTYIPTQKYSVGKMYNVIYCLHMEILEIRSLYTALHFKYHMYVLYTAQKDTAGKR